MASTIKNLICLFFLITTLLSSTQTHARDSHFFSKVSRNRDGASTPSQNYYDNNQENVAKSTPIQQEKEEEPRFIPQTTHSGYGLYGHESGLDTPSNMDDTKYENQNNFNKNNNNNNNNYDNFEKYREERSYVPKVQGLSETSYTNNYNNDDNVVVPRNYVGENNYNNNNYNNNNNKNVGVEKEGLSDTRYLENGKYFYDINNEKKFDSTNNNEFSYNNNLKNDNYNNDFDNNNLSNNNYNNGKGIYPGYQSKFPKEEEFDFDDQP